ncbi:MAG: response regulator transcription factor [Nitrospirota bacterium]
MGHAQILLAGLHPLLMEDVRLQFEDRYDLISAPGDRNTLVTTVRRTRPDAVVLDLPAQSRAGLDVVRRLRAASHDTKVIVASWRTDPAFIIDAFRSGASAYLVKPTVPTELPCAVQTVLRGRRYLSSLAGRRRGLIVHAQPETVPPRRFPGREKELLRLIGRGYSAKTIAEKLHLSAEAVGEYIARLMKQLGAKTRRGLSRYLARRSR